MEQENKRKVSVLFMLFGTLFCVCLITANVLETKQLSFGPVNLTAGIIVFPVSYIINDVVCEVWGYQRTRMLIWMGFAAGSHMIPQFYGSIVSTLIISIGLFFFKWEMALAAVWPIPIALAIVLTSKKVQNHFTRKQKKAQIELNEGVQEFIETSRDLKSNNAENEYLTGLDEKIDALEKRAIGSELGSAVFVVSAQMLLKFGIGTVALAGGTMLIGGSLTLMQFFCFLLVASRLYEPMSSTLINLAAVNALQINVDRMNDINNTKEQEGAADFVPNGYDIVFDHAGFSYEDEKTVLSDVSFTAKQGEVTALVGPSGGGKTTVSRLAARFWDADKGKVTVGGVDVKTVDPETLLGSFSIVFQDVTLFKETLNKAPYTEQKTK